jgi:RecA/RadA recombinase
MAKKPTKKIEKKEGFLSSFKEKRGMGKKKIKDKAMSWVPFNKAFYDATGCPGVPRGYTSQFRGFSDTGKSTAMYETIVGAQKLGEFVLIIDTEGSFSWSHARDIGVRFEEVVDEETGEVIDYKDGDNLLFASGKDLLDMYRKWDYKDGKEKTKSLRNIPVIEDVARLINEVFDAQDEGIIDKPSGMLVR